jgi:hypothetical protein
MIGNRDAYDAAYHRALAGHHRPIWEVLMATFEDEYTRESRQKGEQAGAAARRAALETQTVVAQDA